MMLLAVIQHICYCFCSFVKHKGPHYYGVAQAPTCSSLHEIGVNFHTCLQVVVYEGDRTMGGLDQDSLRFEGNCTLQVPKSSTHCTDCFSTITAFQNKVCAPTELPRRKACQRNWSYVLGDACPGACPLRLTFPQICMAHMRAVRYSIPSTDLMITHFTLISSVVGVMLIVHCLRLRPSMAHFGIE